MTLREQMQIDRQFAKRFNNSSYYLLGILVGLFFSSLYILIPIDTNLPEDIMGIGGFIAVSHLIMQFSYMHSYLYLIEDHHEKSVLMKFDCIPVDKHIYMLSKYMLLLRFSLFVLIPQQVVHTTISVLVGNSWYSIASLIPTLTMTSSYLIILALTFTRFGKRKF